MRSGGNKYAFLLRDAMRKRGTYGRCLSVRMSVRLSDAFVYCIQIAKDIVKLLPQPRSPSI